MKYLGFGLVLFFLVYGSVLAFTKKQNIDDSKAIKAYVKSRGAAPIPKTWRTKIGEGI